MKRKFYEQTRRTKRRGGTTYRPIKLYAAVVIWNGSTALQWHVKYLDDGSKGVVRTRNIIWSTDNEHWWYLDTAYPPSFD